MKPNSDSKQSMCAVTEQQQQMWRHSLSTKLQTEAIKSIKDGGNYRRNRVKLLASEERDEAPGSSKTHD